MKTEKYFNTTGYCNPKLHYMIDPYRGLKSSIMGLIEKEQYFVIQSPQQTGKTTLLHALADELNACGRYTALAFSVESTVYGDIGEKEANYRISVSLHSASMISLPELERPRAPVDGERLEYYIMEWCRAQSKPIVLLIDEIDSLHYGMLISVLRQLSNGFQGRHKGYFPVSVGLVERCDLSAHKIKVGPQDMPLGRGSAFNFNFKAESFMMPGFTEGEVRELLGQHTAQTGQEFPENCIKSIYELGSGQPWLINALAGEIAYKILGGDFSKAITVNLIQKAKENLIARRGTHLSNLIKKLWAPDVKNVVSAIITGNPLFFDEYGDSVLYCIDLGIIKQADGFVRFSNEIYKEAILQALNYNFQVSFDEDTTSLAKYIRRDGSLDIEALISAFKDFYRHNSETWLEHFAYKEAGPQLLLLAFLQRVINGKEAIDSDMTLGSGRTNLCLHWQGQKYALELKLNRGDWSREEGLKHLINYMHKLGGKRGFLFLFETKPNSEIAWDKRIYWKTENIGNKEITVIGI